MAATNTGIVLRTITGVHDANFVHPLGDNELNTGAISNAGGGSFTLTDSGLKAVSDGTSASTIRPRILWNTLTIGRQYRIVGRPTINSGSTTYALYDGASYVKNQVAVEGFDITFTCNGASVFFTNDGTQTFDIDWDLSIKEVLVNRESTATNTGIVERSVVGVHDANFVHPIGDELITNGGFDDGSTDWNLLSDVTSSFFENGIANIQGTANSANNGIKQTSISAVIGKTYKISATLRSNDGGLYRFRLLDGSYFDLGSGNSSEFETITSYHTATSTVFTIFATSWYTSGTADFSIDNISVKEVLVNRESTATNTGIVERPITGVNESDPMFPDNTISNIVNIAGLISSLIADLKARATTFENEDATQNILINLQNC